MAYILFNPPEIEVCAKKKKSPFLKLIYSCVSATLKNEYFPLDKNTVQ